MYKVEKIIKNNILVELTIKKDNEYKIINICENDFFNVGIFSPGIISYNTFVCLKNFHIDKEKFILALRYITRKRRTILEVSEMLNSNNSTEEEINLIISKLCDYKYLDDKKYLDDFLDYQLNLKMNGPKKIKYMLVSKFEEKFFLDYVDKVYTKDKIILNLQSIHNELIKKEYLSIQDYKRKMINKCIYKGYQPEHLNIFFSNLDFNSIKVKINKDKIYTIAKTYNDKLILSKKYNEYQRKRKLYSYLLMKKIPSEVIEKLILSLT